MRLTNLSVVNIKLFLFSSSLLASNFQPNLPPNMKTGIFLNQDEQDEWEEERFRRAQNKLLCKEINELGAKELNERIEKAKIKKLLEIRSVVGAKMFFFVPKTLLLYADLSPNDSYVELAKKYLRLAFAIKDMYEDLQINKELFSTYYCPDSMRLNEEQRYALMSICYIQAINYLQMVEREAVFLIDDLSVEGIDYYIDLVRSMSEIEIWLAHAIKKSSIDDEFESQSWHYAKRAQMRLWGLDFFLKIPNSFFFIQEFILQKPI